MQNAVDRVLDAVRRGDWDTLRPLLHPYLQWTDRAGETIRGRRKVMARLSGGSTVTTPRGYELRDGQIYRWREE